MLFFLTWRIYIKQYFYEITIKIKLHIIKHFNNEIKNSYNVLIRSSESKIKIKKSARVCN